MLPRERKPFIRNFVFMMVLLSGLCSVTPVKASDDAIPQIKVSTPSYPVGMESGERKLVTYSITESGNISGKIISRTYQFYTQYDELLSDRMGPYTANVKVNALETTQWDELVYLPQHVVDQARAMREYALVLKTTFLGKSSFGTDFEAQASLLILLPPAEFSKASPANGAFVQPIDLSLLWNGSVGAIDYEYCFDIFDNGVCDTDWTGTYWLGTYDTNAALQNVSAGTIYYWQVRANNMSGTTYANNGEWWSFQTACYNKLIIVTNTNDSGAGSLRQAIADICPGGIINFDTPLSDQTIVLKSTLLIYKDLTIDGSSLASQISISGNSTARVFFVNSGVTSTFKSLIIINGGSVTEGGGIYNQGTLTITNSVFAGNHVADNGGGILNNMGTLTVTGSRLTGNMASDDGGAIYNLLGSLVITDSSLDNNSASRGGGIACSGNTGTMIASGNTYLSNTAYGGSRSADGGAIYNTCQATITNSTFSANAASLGGAVLTDRDTDQVVITNSTFSGNSASIGGGVYNAGKLLVTNSTFSDHKAANAGAIQNALGGMLSLRNSILANSLAGGDCSTSDGATIVENINTLIESNGIGLQSCGTPLLSGDPLLGPLSYNGGTTWTMALLPGSPAIDAGDASSCPATDQRGVTRPQGSGCDIGAFEADAVVTPTPTSTPPYSYQPLYLSLTGSQTIGGISSANEDILRFDGTNWSRFFDGSDVGLGSLNLFAFSIVDEDTILMSFSSTANIGGIDATPQDILRFDATSLGDITAGTFSMYFDGSDVGFDNTSSEKIDSITLLPDGRLLLSTAGTPSIPGLTSGKDEDVLAFTPISLGWSTSGTWALYFDGSDVGLSEASDEDIDALDVVGANVYLSTSGNFSVAGLSGADEDVFVCAATSIGDVTACSYSPSLYFDGSTWGLTSNDVDAFNFLSSGSVPTPTTMPVTPTITPTAAQTATPGAPVMLIFTPEADARVSEASPATNYGNATTLLVDSGAGAGETSYIRFTASGLPGSIQSVRLRVYCTTNGTNNGPAAYLADNIWTETGTGGITWNLQPVLLSGAFDNKETIAAGSWVDYDVTALVAGNGTYTFALVGDGTDGVTFSSSEGTTPPQLVIEIAP